MSLALAQGSGLLMGSCQDHPGSLENITAKAEGSIQGHRLRTPFGVEPGAHPTKDRSSHPAQHMASGVLATRMVSSVIPDGLNLFNHCFLHVYRGAYQEQYRSCYWKRRDCRFYQNAV